MSDHPFFMPSPRASSSSLAAGSRSLENAELGCDARNLYTNLYTVRRVPDTVYFPPANEFRKLGMLRIAENDEEGEDRHEQWRRELLLHGVPTEEEIREVRGNLEVLRYKRIPSDLATLGSQYSLVSMYPYVGYRSFDLSFAQR